MMQKIRDISTARWMVLAMVLSFGAGFSLALWREKLTMSDMVIIASPTIAVVVLALLYTATLMVWRRMLRSNLGKRWDNRDSWLGLVFSLVVAVVAFGWSWLATMAVLDESSGVAIRSSTLLSKLPEGNLLLGGGMLIEGWAYFLVFTGTLVFFFWKSIIAKFVALKHWRPSMPERQERRDERLPKSERLAKKRNKKSDVSSGEDTADILSQMFADSQPAHH